MIRAKRSAGRKFRRRFFKIFFVFFAVFIIFQLISVNLNILQKQKELDALREKVDFQVQQNELLQKQLDFGITNDYIVKMAREKLNLVLPSERIFIDIAKE